MQVADWLQVNKESKQWTEMSERKLVNTSIA